MANVTGRWNGGGDLKAGRHRGEADFTGVSWSREDAGPITAVGGLAYDWPAGFQTRGLRVQTAGQTVELEAALAQGLLELKRFVWSNGPETNRWIESFLELGDDHILRASVTDMLEDEPVEGHFRLVGDELVPAEPTP